MDYRKFVKEQVKDIKRMAGNRNAISAISGGVDSSVCTVIAHRALGRKLKVIFIDDGLMREGEPAQIKRIFAKLGINVIVINRAARFFKALKGKIDPELKRKAFRDTFYRVLGEEVKKADADCMIQGTIAADIIETKKGVKTQHNILDQIGISAKKRYGFTAVEPLKTLFKDQVRIVGKLVGLPKEIHQRMPFPGPGLSCRVIGEANQQSVAIVRRAVKIVEEEVKNIKMFQALAVLLNDRATGITKDKRRVFGQIIAVRCVHSTNAMWAEPVNLDWKVLTKIRTRILKEIPSVSKVVYDLTPKPPSTIEYI